ncbi:Predicted arabinose efflux permease, MFS family [Amycolatopsis xylanica]|uniref:Predicted arabinose efflux permease, MFS family n=1 Tax=Amycolatopsis xylanica TaxID=589385 RepID=A0A1H3NSQ5_9PSEU|nr:MFS transporter [Amycolatopsis xylanica]SDY91465.1 Predicted arabinose efflux permease, MFS family [Amycolatopsis xylanica]
MVTHGGARFREVFAVAEFRALFAAQLVSVAGDQLARVALAVLVFDRTASAGWAALAYAVTLVPDLLGGPLLSGLADRYPRRSVMVAADLVRMALVAFMAVPGASLVVVGALLVIVQLANTPWAAARAAVLPQVLSGERFVAGTAVFAMTTQAAQVLGFATGGVLVAWLDPDGALLVDAVTFAASAALIAGGLRHRPASSGLRWRGRVLGGLALVWRDRRLRALVALACVSGFYIAGEAVAAPYAAELGGGAVAVGLLLASYAVGNVVGMAILARLPEAVRVRSMVPMAIASCAPLLGCAADPGLGAVLALWCCSGVASAYNLTASTLFVTAVPDHVRGQAFGLAVTALRVAQGAGVVVAGVAADGYAPHQVVAAAGLLGVVAAAGAGLAWKGS